MPAVKYDIDKAGGHGNYLLSLGHDVIQGKLEKPSLLVSWWVKMTQKERS